MNEKEKEKTEIDLQKDYSLKSEESKKEEKSESKSFLLEQN